MAIHYFVMLRFIKQINAVPLSTLIHHILDIVTGMRCLKTTINTEGKFTTYSKTQCS